MTRYNLCINETYQSLNEDLLRNKKQPVKAAACESDASDILNACSLLQVTCVELQVTRFQKERNCNVLISAPFTFHFVIDSSFYQPR